MFHSALAYSDILGDLSFIDQDELLITLRHPSIKITGVLSSLVFIYGTEFIVYSGTLPR